MGIFYTSALCRSGVVAKISKTSKAGKRNYPTALSLFLSFCGDVGDKKK